MKHEQSMLEYVCNWTTVLEAGELWIPNHSKLHSETLSHDKKKIWKRQKRNASVSGEKEKEVEAD